MGHYAIHSAGYLYKIFFYLNCKLSFPLGVRGKRSSIYRVYLGHFCTDQLFYLHSLTEIDQLGSVRSSDYKCTLAFPLGG